MNNQSTIITMNTQQYQIIMNHHLLCLCRRIQLLMSVPPPPPPGHSAHILVLVPRQSEWGGGPERLERESCMRIIWSWLSSVKWGSDSSVIGRVSLAHWPTVLPGGADRTFGWRRNRLEDHESFKMIVSGAAKTLTWCNAPERIFWFNWNMDMLWSGNLGLIPIGVSK